MVAIRYLPYPMMVLDDQKTLVMANEAMGRLLDIEVPEGVNDEETSIVEKLWGKTLSQIGIDVLQHGKPIWVIWDSFLDAIAREIDAESEVQKGEVSAETQEDQGPSGLSEEPAEALRRITSKSRTAMHDTVLEVVISPDDMSVSQSPDGSNKTARLRHTYAKMIVTVWELDDERYFTLTFTNTDTHHAPVPKSGRRPGRPKMKRPHEAADVVSSGSAASILKHASIYRRASITPAITNPADLDTSESPFPPLGPPPQSAVSSQSSSLQKLFVMKDALLDSTEVPIIAMWKDYGLTISNRAARQLFHINAKPTDVKDGYELMSNWQTWDEGFTAQLETPDYPIIQLIRTEQPFQGRRIGLVDAAGYKHILDCSGEAIRDEATGEFLAGMVTARDITDMTEKIRDMTEKNEQRFQVICDSMPQMIWTNAADGTAEWFSERW